MAVYKRGETWWIRFQHGGVEVRESARTTSKTEAKAFERKRRTEVGSHGHKLRPRTFGEAMVKYIESGAQFSMVEAINLTREYLENVPLEKTPYVAQDMRDSLLADGLSPLTINRRLAVVRRILNLAYREWGWLDQPLGQKIAMMSTKGTERHTYLNRDEVMQLASKVSNPRVAAVMLLAAYTGLRRGEILGLQPSNWHKPYIILGNDTKTKRPRTIPLVEELHYIMDLLPFKVTAPNLRSHFIKARESIGRPDIRFHDLRHTFASWLASDPDVPLTVIRDVLGHSSLTMTSRYAHLRTSALDVVTRSLTQNKNETGTKTGTDGYK